MPAKYLVPNEDGILIPSDVPEMHELSDSERALSLACNSGGSGEGMSHYSQASRCGRRARLSTARYKSFADKGAALPLTKNHFVIGSVYHKLHELARRDPKDETLVIDFDEQYQNPNVAEGLRLYKGWLRHWGLDYWGKCLGVEVHLADDETFGCRVTGALDMVVEMDQAACDRAKKRGLELTPGRRIVDWKSADGPSDGVQFREGMQALWYCHLWNLHNPDRPVDGIIFDVVMKRSRRKDRSVLTDDFQAFYIVEGRESIESLRGMVTQGHRNIVEDVPNRSECVTWRGEICPFRTYGDCDAT